MCVCVCVCICKTKMCMCSIRKSTISNLPPHVSAATRHHQGAYTPIYLQHNKICCKLKLDPSWHKHRPAIHRISTPDFIRRNLIISRCLNAEYFSK